MLTHQEASALATRKFGFEITPNDIAAECALGLLPSFGLSRLVRQEEVLRAGAGVFIHESGASLFSDLRRVISDSRTAPPSLLPAYHTSDDVLFIRPGLNLAIGVSGRSQRPEFLQLLLAAIRRTPTDALVGHDAGTITTLDLTAEVSIWSGRHLNASKWKDIWKRVESSEAVASSLDTVVVPKMYGSKIRSTQFLAGVCRSYAIDETPLLDVMSGTGIVSAKLAPYFPICANDANPYATLLTKAHFLDVDSDCIDRIRTSFNADYQYNLEQLRSIAQEALEQEQSFLHAEQTEELLQEYRNFCLAFPLGDLRLDQEVKRRGKNPSQIPFCLITGYFSNAYFGVQQSAQIDSIRYAISRLTEPNVQDLLLASLLTVCAATASSPHFAQPPKLTHPRALREVIEHRARDVYAEFFVTVGIVLSHRRQSERLLKSYTSDWREAIERFLKSESTFGTGQRLMYLDPPYSKLQFSRYYHVLNTLIDYDYPGHLGQGRYPPLAKRFSSRFEYQPGPAEKEFGDIFRVSADGRLITVVSYSDTGFVRPESIVTLLEKYFASVHVYSKSLRHNSQGTSFRAGRQNVTEFVFVGIP